MKRKAKIYYAAMDDFWRREAKLEWLRENPIGTIAFETITPDTKHNWINQTDNDWDVFMPLVDKDVKLGKKQDAAVFELYANSVKTNRDEWLYDFSTPSLEAKIRFFIEKYNLQKPDDELDKAIKWSDDLQSKHKQGHPLIWDSGLVMDSLYKPFVRQSFYSEKVLSDRMTDNHYRIFGKSLREENKVIMFVAGSRLTLSCLVSNFTPNYAIYSLDPAQCLPLFSYDSDGIRHENITDWAVEEFARRGASGLSKDDIFHYVYAVLHYPPYREKYGQNLKREFPRIPVYKNARYWVDYGRMLMELHLNYETVEPYRLGRVEVEPLLWKKKTSSRSENVDASANTAGFVPKPVVRLKADKASGIIEIDSQTRLEGVPAIAWEYKLGNRSALEWVLDQYKERKPKDPTIAEKFNTYKFADYKEHVIDLLKRVCSVSVKTMEIVGSMPDDSAPPMPKAARK